MGWKQVFVFVCSRVGSQSHRGRRRISRRLRNTSDSVDQLETRILLAADFGDAPDKSAVTGVSDYQTTLANNGARHVIDSTRTTLFLGASVDDEPGVNQGFNAELDDLFSAGRKDDEDGVLNQLDLFSTVGASAKVTLSATNRTGRLAMLYGWVDFNRNGVFENATERASISIPNGTTAGKFTLPFPAFLPPSPGSTFARFRISTDAAAANSTGLASDGEVEDYPFVVQPRVDLRRPEIIFSNLAGGPAVEATSYFGATTTPVGDLDGNGVIDIAVGAPGENSEAGAVYVVFRNSDGTAKSFTRIASGVSGGPTLGPSEFFGASMESLGDIDGDGIIDLAIGSLGTKDKGAVYISRLKADGSLKSVTKLASGINGFPVVHDDARAGVVAPIGDIDNDGVRDLAIGAPGIDAGGESRGAVYIVRLKPDGTVKSTSSIINTSTWNPRVADDNQFGLRITPLGDLDRDGAQEIAVLSDISAGSSVAISVVDVLSLNSDGTMKRTKRIISDSRAEQMTPQNIFGLNVVGDINGDGINDVVIAGNLNYSLSNIRDQIVFATLNSDASIQRLVELPQHRIPIRGTFLSGISVLGNSGVDGALQLLIGMPLYSDFETPAPRVDVAEIPNAVVNTTFPDVPKDLYPVGQIRSFEPWLQWRNDPSASEFLVWLKSDDSGEVLLNSVSTLGHGVQIKSGLEIGTYSFAVRAKNEIGFSAWSPTVKFTVTGAIEVLPVADGMDRRPVVRWRRFPTAAAVTTYEILIFNAATNATVTRTTVSTLDYLPDWTPETDLPDGKYKLWIRGVTNRGLKSLWSAVEEFSVVTKTQITSVTRQFVKRPHVYVTAVPEAELFEAEIRNLSNPSAPLITQRLLPIDTSDGITKLTILELPSGMFQIRVRPVAKNGQTGDWSSAVDFQTEIRPVLDPLPERFNPGATVSVTWPALPGANEYSLTILTAERYYSTQVRTNSLQLPVSTQGEYRLQLAALEVIPHGESAKSQLSEIVRFTVVGRITDVRVQNDARNPQPLTLTWSQVPGATRYEISFDPATTNKTVAAIVNATSFALPDSVRQSDVVVFVRGITPDGTTTDWSSGLTLKRDHFAASPSVSVVSLFERRLAWSPVPGATGYDVLVYDLTRHKYLPAWTGVTSTSVVAEIVLDGRYEWVVRARGLSGVSVWSSLVGFEIDRVPVLSVPAEFQSTDVSKSISWTAIDGAETYDLWITNRSNVTTLREQRVPQNSFDLGSRLGPGTHIAWVRVVASDGRLLPWGVPRMFEVVGSEAPPVVTGLKLVNSAFDLSQRTLTWARLPGYSRFEVRIDDTVNHVEGIISDPFVYSHSFLVPQSLQPDTFAIRIRAISPNGYLTEWSAPLQPAINQVARPGDVLADSLFGRSLTWAVVPGATSYDVLVRNVSANKYLPGWYGLTGNSVTATNLAEGRYEWTIRAKGVSGIELWSPAGTFTVNRTPVVTVPASFNLSDSSKLIVWDEILGATGYDIWVMNYRYATVLRNTSVSTTSLDLRSLLPAGSTFRVWVRALDPAGLLAPWSVVREFSIV
jgi:hypothetical protein